MCAVVYNSEIPMRNSHTHSSTLNSSGCFHYIEKVSTALMRQKLHFESLGLNPGLNTECPSWALTYLIRHPERCNL